jgi:hypothetical protein
MKSVHLTLVIRQQVHTAHFACGPRGQCIARLSSIALQACQRLHKSRLLDSSIISINSSHACWGQTHHWGLRHPTSCQKRHLPCCSAEHCSCWSQPRTEPWLRSRRKTYPFLQSPLGRLDEVSRLAVKTETHLRTLNSRCVRLGHLAFALVRHLREGFVVFGVVLERLSV